MITIDDFVRPTSCSDCPFSDVGDGLALRESLAPGRFEGIQKGLQKGKTFDCHQTRNGARGRRPKSARVCAGALAWQRKNDCIPAAVQVVERLIARNEGRPARW